MDPCPDHGDFDPRATNGLTRTVSGIAVSADATNGPASDSRSTSIPSTDHIHRNTFEGQEELFAVESGNIDAVFYDDNLVFPPLPVNPPQIPFDIPSDVPVDVPLNVPFDFSFDPPFDPSFDPSFNTPFLHAPLLNADAASFNSFPALPLVLLPGDLSNHHPAIHDLGFPELTPPAAFDSGPLYQDTLDFGNVGGFTDLLELDSWFHPNDPMFYTLPESSGGEATFPPPRVSGPVPPVESLGEGSSIHVALDSHPAIADDNEANIVAPTPVAAADSHGSTSHVDVDRPQNALQRIHNSNKVLRGTACSFCYLNKRKCDSNPRCLQCMLKSIPADMCVRVRFTEEPIFKKWNVGLYQSKMRWGQLNWVPGQITMNLYHFDNGPAILVKCRQFIPDSPEQCQVWGRTPGGWRLEPTAAFGLDSAVSEEYVAQYISECVPYCAEEAARNSPQLRTIIQNASRQDKLLPLALQLWTANRLLMRGWQAKEDPALGICRVTDPESPYYNTTIAPRVLQNQIDSRVEAFMARVELQLLKDLQKAMKQKTCSWIEIFSTVFLILRVAEKDIWRLMYWLRHENEAYKWKHPESASKLAQRSIFCCNLLLTYLHNAGSVPIEFTKSNTPSLDRIGQAATLYEEMNDDSVDDTLSSLAFVENWQEGNAVQPKEFGCK